MIEEAVEGGEFILVVTSPEYRRRVNRKPSDAKGRGVQYEAGLIREQLYDDRDGRFSRILPVVLPGGSHADVPQFLLPRAGTVYFVRSFTVPGAESLLRTLTGQPGEVRPALGAVPDLPPRPAPREERAALLDELVEALGTLPIVRNVGGRAEFARMTAERLTMPVQVCIDQEPVPFLSELVDALAARPGGLAALADTVNSLHRSEPIERRVRRLAELLAMNG